VATIDNSQLVQCVPESGNPSARNRSGKLQRNPKAVFTLSPLQRGATEKLLLGAPKYQYSSGSSRSDVVQWSYQ